MVTVIYNKGYPLSVIKILLNISLERTLKVAKDMDTKKSLGNYDVLQFEHLEDAMNFFITEAIQQGHQSSFVKNNHNH